MKLIAACCLVILLSTTGTVKAQDSLYNLKYTLKGRTDTAWHSTAWVGSNSFYLYRDCYYDFVFSKRKHVKAKVVDIKNDSVYYTPYWIDMGDSSRSGRYDTMSIHPASIKKIGYYNNAPIMLTPYKACRLKNYNYYFEKSDVAMRFKILKDTTWAYDSTHYTPYETFYYMSSDFGRVHERSGETVYVRPPKPKPFYDYPKYIVRKVAWFTPSNASDIRGLNITLQTMNINDGPLTISGVNVGADLVSAFGFMYVLGDIGNNNNLRTMPDTIDQSEKEITVRGLHASFGGFVGDEVSGLVINGMIGYAREANGLIITGMMNVISQFRGIVISPIKNKSIKGAGLQIGLVNICKHLKGVQIGLWNVNSKRKFPIINWCFKSS